MDYPIYLAVINPDIQSDVEVNFIALVDKPAIERNFLAFQKFVEPTSGEPKDEFLPRCIKYVINEGKEEAQAVAICNSLWTQHFASSKISFDYDNTLDTPKGKALAEKAIKGNNDVYIISARHDKKDLLPIAKELGIDESKAYATGSLDAKVAKIKELGISKHFDDNLEVIKKLPDNIGQKFISNISRFAINEEKRIISGAAMIADMPIYRKDKDLGEYYVVFDAASIQDIVQKFSAKGFMTNFNLFHDDKAAVSDVTIFNSFISNTDLGIHPPEGFSDCANGSWFISAKVNNDAVWERIKSGELRGFSVEGLFNYIPMQQKKYTVEQAHAMIEKILSETDFCE
jgi:Putative phage serine protease XkdF